MQKDTEVGYNVVCMYHCSEYPLYRHQHCVTVYLNKIQKCRPLNFCGQSEYECASEPYPWEVLVSAYSHGLSADTYKACMYNFSRAFSATSTNTIASIYFDIYMTAAANVCRQCSRK